MNDKNYTRPNRGDTVMVLGYFAGNKGFVYNYMIRNEGVNNNARGYFYEIQIQRTIIREFDNKEIAVATPFTKRELNKGANCGHHLMTDEWNLIPVSMLLIERIKRYD